MKKLSYLFLMVWSILADASNCYVTAVKDNCWVDYTVTIFAVDLTANNNVIATITIPKGQTWTRLPFDCQPNQQVLFNAQFTPPIWAADANKNYRSINFWSIPKNITETGTVYNITLCFSGQFSEVPLPPAVQGACQCDLKSIPPIPPTPPIAPK